MTGRKRSSKKVWGVPGSGARAAPGARPLASAGAPRASCSARGPPAPGARPPLTLQDDLFERLPLQPVPAPQLLRDVALPAGEVGGAETRRHGARGLGAQRRRSERGLGAAARTMRRPAGAGRRQPHSSPPPAGRPQRHPGPASGSCRKWFWPRPEDPPPRRRLAAHARSCSAPTQGARQ